MSLRRRLSILQILAPYSLVFWAAVLCSETSFGHIILGLLSLISLGAAIIVTGVVGTSRIWLWAIGTYLLSLAFWLIVLRVFLGMHLLAPVRDQDDLRP
jgi:hypothetical protein